MMLGSLPAGFSDATVDDEVFGLRPDHPPDPHTKETN